MARTKNKDSRQGFSANPMVYEQAAQSVIKMICSDGFSKGDRLPSERRLSELLGINYLSVRRGMLLLVEQGIIHRHVGQGTFLLLDPKAIPDSTGFNRTAGLKEKQSSKQPQGAKFAVILLQPYEPFQVEVAGEVLADLGRMGCDISYNVTSTSLPKLQKESSLYAEKGVSGMVVLNTPDTELASRQLVSLCRNSSLPVVLSRHYENLSEYFYGVQHNLKPGWNESIASQLGCTYFAGLGVKNLYYLTPPIEDRLTRKRRALSFNNSAQDLAIQSEVIECSTRKSDLAPLISKLKEQRGQCAVFCYDDETAASFMLATGATGLSVPEDVSVLGMNNTRIASMVDPAISTMTFDYAYISRSIVCKLLSNAGASTPVWPTPSLPRLVIRESCGIHNHYRSNDKAKAYIKQIQSQSNAMIQSYRSTTIPTLT